MVHKSERGPTAGETCPQIAQRGRAFSRPISRGRVHPGADPGARGLGTPAMAPRGVGRGSTGVSKQVEAVGAIPPTSPRGRYLKGFYRSAASTLLESSPSNTTGPPRRVGGWPPPARPSRSLPTQGCLAWVRHPRIPGVLRPSGSTRGIAPGVLAGGSSDRGVAMASRRVGLSALHLEGGMQDAKLPFHGASEAVDDVPRLV